MPLLRSGGSLTPSCPAFRRQSPISQRGVAINVQPRSPGLNLGALDYAYELRAAAEGPDLLLSGMPETPATGLLS